MALTDEQRQEAILDEIGDPSGTLADKIAVQWDKYAAYAVNPALRDLYVKRALIRIEYARLARTTDFSDGDYSQKASQAAAAVRKMLDDVNAEIAEAEAVGLGAGGAAIGTLTTTSPESPPTGPLVRPHGPDALDPPYRGSPYYPRRRASRW